MVQILSLIVMFRYVTSSLMLALISSLSWRVLLLLSFYTLLQEQTSIQCYKYLMFKYWVYLLIIYYAHQLLHGITYLRIK